MEGAMGVLSTIFLVRSFTRKPKVSLKRQPGRMADWSGYIAVPAERGQLRFTSKD